MARTSGGTGRVLVNYGRECVVATGDELLPCRMRRGMQPPVCGDLVHWADDGHGGGLIDDVQERRNVFCKAGPGGQPRVVASNLDSVLIVIAPRPTPSADLVDRYLVAVHALNLEPLLVGNKSELPEFARPDFTAILDEFAALGYRVHRVSAREGTGLQQLQQNISGQVTILVGQSGVGKSSLINALVPDRDIRVGRLSAATGKGAHTTTATTLYELGDGGAVVDSPGVWEYGVWKMKPAQLVAGFPEFNAWLGACRFRDCRHVAEPDCAIRDAVRSNRIPRRRWESYCRLAEETA